MRFLEAVQLLPLILISTTTITSGCRSGLRTQATEGDPVTVEMKITNLADADRGRSELVYTLSGCGSGSANGTKTSDSSVNFQTQSVRKDDRCDLKINTAKNDSKVANWFAEEGLLYEARRVAITSREGKLQGTAVLQQLYSTPPTITGTPQSQVWSLSVGLKAPKALSELCTCKLYCDPGLENKVAKLDLAEDKSIGSCEFANVVKPELAKVACTALTVQCGNEYFVGKWTTAATVNGSQSARLSLPNLAIEAGIPEETSETTIEVVVPR